MKSNNFSHFRLVLAFFCFAGIAKTSYGQLSGAYTINPSAAASATNYQNFHSAVADLDSGKRYDGGTANGSGVKGRVVFNVAAGSYEEKLDITYISGSSATNSITFQSQSNDSTKVLLYSASSYSTKGNYTLQLDSAAFITFRHITITRTGSLPNGQALNMLDLLEDDTFSGCQVLGIDGATSNLAPNIVISLNNSLDKGICFNGNLIWYGYTGFSCSAASGNNLLLTGNQFDSSTDVLLDIKGVDSVILRNNILNGPGEIIISSNYAALYYNTINTVGEFEVSPQTYILIGNNINIGRSYYPPFNLNYIDYEKNIIYGNIDLDLYSNPNSPNGYINIEKNIIYGNVSVNLQNGQCKVINNFIGQYLSIDNEGTADFSVLFNNILSTNGNESVNISVGSGGTTVLKNNNIVNYYAGTGSGGAVLYVSSYNDFPTQSDYNNYYSSSNTTPFEIGTYQLNLSDYQAASGMDSNSIFIDPQFVSDSNLHSANTKLAGKGIYINGIIDDIDGKLRPNHPTIGANELADTLHFITALIGVGDTNNIIYPVQFKDKSQSNNCGKIDKWLWEFGDGKTDTLENPSHTYASAGNYTVKLIVRSSSGCIDSTSTVIMVHSIFINALFTDRFIGNNLVVFQDGSSSTNCGPLDEWVWEFGDGTSQTYSGINDSLENPDHEYNSAGNYLATLIVYSTLGCVDSFSEVIVINGTKGDSSGDSTHNHITAISSNILPQQNVKIYPNPFSSIFTIETGGNIIKSVQLTDITGRDVTSSIKVTPKPLQIDATALPSGIYFIRLNFENGNYVGKAVKE